MKKRFEPLRGNPYYEWGENCSYGFNEALTIVITLLIDEDIEGVGHRKNILKESCNSVGSPFVPTKPTGSTVSWTSDRKAAPGSTRFLIKKPSSGLLYFPSALSPGFLFFFREECPGNNSGGFIRGSHGNRFDLIGFQLFQCFINSI